jgi:hypothetical protein
LRSAETLEIVSRATAFLVKLWRILAEPSYGHAIQWTTDSEFTIVDTKAFERDVLPIFFRSSHYASFQRQLNYFSFSKVGKCAYTHPDFDRSNPSRVLQIKRKTNTGNLTKKRKAHAEKLSHEKNQTAVPQSGSSNLVPLSDCMQQLRKKPREEVAAADFSTSSAMGNKLQPRGIERPRIVSPLPIPEEITVQPHAVSSTPFYDCLILCDRLTKDISMKELKVNSVVADAITSSISSVRFPYLFGEDDLTEFERGLDWACGLTSETPAAISPL